MAVVVAGYALGTETGPAQGQDADCAPGKGQLRRLTVRPVALISSNASPRCVANDARPQGLDGTPRPAQAQPLSAPSRGKLKPSRPSERDNRSFREFRRQERQSTRQDLGGAAINLPAVGGKTDAELSLNLGDGVPGQAAAVWAWSSLMASISSPSANFTP